jgi:hypothetical protein
MYNRFRAWVRSLFGLKDAPAPQPREFNFPKVVVEPYRPRQPEVIRKSSPSRSTAVRTATPTPPVYNRPVSPVNSINTWYPASRSTDYASSSDNTAVNVVAGALIGMALANAAGSVQASEPEAKNESKLPDFAPVFEPSNSIDEIGNPVYADSYNYRSNDVGSPVSEPEQRTFTPAVETREEPTPSYSHSYSSDSSDSSGSDSYSSND